MEQSKNIVEQIINYLKSIILNLDDEQTPLPSEYFLANKFKVSRMTARKALEQLKNQGFIVAKRGSGYYKKNFQSYSQLCSVGKNEFHSYATTKINKLRDASQVFQLIISKLNIKLKINANDYFSYQKIYYDQHGEIKVCVNSFILKAKFEKIDIVEIQKSLMTFIMNNKIDVFCQINTSEIENSSPDDWANFHQILTPVTYGALISKDDEYIELFVHRYQMNEFKNNWIKFY